LPLSSFVLLSNDKNLKACFFMKTYMISTN